MSFGTFLAPAAAALLTFVAGAVQAEAPKQFDLVCTVHRGADPTPIDVVRWQIDSIAGTWCDKYGCGRLRATEDRLWFNTAHVEQTPFGIEVTSQWVDRRTANLTETASYGGVDQPPVSGPCKIAPYRSSDTTQF